eukprot:2255089-Rhodomonas_salina.3
MHSETARLHSQTVVACAQIMMGHARSAGLEHAVEARYSRIPHRPTIPSNRKRPAQHQHVELVSSLSSNSLKQCAKQGGPVKVF